MKTKENFLPKSLPTFPNQELAPRILRSFGPYLDLADGCRYVDLTAGITGFAILGGGVAPVVSAIVEQLEKYPHADYKYFQEPMRDELAELLLAGCPGGLDRILFSGGSGSEACEMALLLSYQVHKEKGQPNKTWAIGTRQSYHGATAGSLALGERPNLEFFSPLLPQNRLRVPECNFQRNRQTGETMAEYAFRAASMLETAILSVGPERVACFVGETMLGGLVGDVPATQGYWAHVREICDRYDVHLILDEVWCGGGVTGKKHCFEWENISPDIVFTGKTIAAGYAPLSLVLTNSHFESVIRNGSGRLELSCTFQGHSVGVAAGIAVQRLIEQQSLLSRAHELGERTRQIIRTELKDHPFLADVRGRGVRTSVAYECPEKNLFGQHVAQILRNEHRILISGKWHRCSLTFSMMIDQSLLDDCLQKLISTFKHVAGKWTESYYQKLSHLHFF